MGKFSFPKEERLTGEKNIKELFNKGSSFFLFPFKIVAMGQPVEGTSINQVVISVSKKNFPRAVDRNLLKRRIREAYRLSKPQFTPAFPLRIAFIYTHKEKLSSAEILTKMVHALARLSKFSPQVPKAS